MKNLDELLMSRRSIRKYQPDRSVSEETLLELIRAAQMAPTWKNSQTGRYYIAASREAVEAVRGMLPGFNQRNSANACAYIVTTFLRDVSGLSLIHI